MPIFFSFLARLLGIGLSQSVIAHDISNAKCSERLAVDEVSLNLYRPYRKNDPSEFFEPRQIRWLLPRKFR